MLTRSPEEKESRGGVRLEFGDCLSRSHKSLRGRKGGANRWRLYTTLLFRQNVGRGWEKPSHSVEGRGAAMENRGHSSALEKVSSRDI